MNEWLLKVAGVTIAVSCAEMLLPRGKIRSACRTVLAIVCVFIIAEPLINLKDIGVTFDIPESSSAMKITDYAEEYYRNLYKNSIEEIIAETGAGAEWCGARGKIEDGEFKLEKIYLKIKQSEVISGEDEHIIDIEEIAKKLAIAFKLEEQDVVVYGSEEERSVR